MKQIKFILLFLFVIVLFSCSKDEGIYFIPNRYTISAKGGEITTAPATSRFGLSSSRIYPLVNYDVFYLADTKDFLKTDFFTAQTTEDYRIKFLVQPNTTGKVRIHYIEVTNGDQFGNVYLTQTAD